MLMTSYSPPDPYGFFGHLDTDLLIVGALCALLVLFGALIDNTLLMLVAASAGILIVVVFQAVRNHRRRIRYKYEPNISQPTD